MVRNTDDDYLDYCLTTAKHGFKIYDTIASTTHFNTSPFESWRSGFRESVKLTLQYEKTQSISEIGSYYKILGRVYASTIYNCHMRQEKISRLQYYEMIPTIHHAITSAIAIRALKGNKV
jgi:hypothetical protein